MNMEQQYNARIRNYAKSLVESNRKSSVRIHPDSRYIIDMSSRYEKTCINRMKRNVARERKNLETYGIGSPVEELEMINEILDVRWEVLSV